MLREILIVQIRKTSFPDTNQLQRYRLGINNPPKQNKNAPHKFNLW